MEDKKITLEDENGKMVEATEIVRIDIANSDIEYLIYSIEKADEDEVLLIPARVKKDENGKEYFERIVDSNEREMVRELFNELLNEKNNLKN